MEKYSVVKEYSPYDVKVISGIEKIKFLKKVILLYVSEFGKYNYFDSFITKNPII